MCGIAGYFSPGTPRRGCELLHTIEHRGPDDQGLAFFDLGQSRHLDCATAGSAAAVRDALLPAGASDQFAHHLAFAHCRYSIVDLTPGGHQPMRDASGRVCISFNGEIYNYVELRTELERAGRHFATRSDTEVLLAGYLQWGEAVFQRLNGQWALSLYDGRQHCLMLSRDRLGKVPLYYAVHRGCLYWASEIKAIAAACGHEALTVRAQAVDEFVVHGRRDSDGTFWNEVSDFPPASFARVDSQLQLQVTEFWQLPRDRLSTKAISTQEAAARVHELLLEAIRIRVRADVPVAFELSGGVDSSTLVALAATHLQGTVTAFCIEFAEKDANEEPYARAVAERFPGKIDYRVIRPGASDFWQDADDFVCLEEEPFHAPNLHTNQSLRRRMKEGGAKVVISGAAGDEVFAGYYGEYFAPYLRYLAAQLEWGLLARELRANTEINGGWKGALLAALDTVSPGLRERLLRIRSKESEHLRDCYRQPRGVSDRGLASPTLAARMLANMGPAKMNYWLRSANKANFAIPIEPRAPFLDYQLLDFAFTLPFEYLIRNGWHKWIVREAMSALLPASVLWRRRKMGFPFPLACWLIESKATVRAALAGSSCPYLDPAQLWQRYDAFAQSAPFALWRLISVGLWWRRVVEGRPLDVQPPA
jgi:asparagine synthase (glutamine-hydrolysing)